MSILRIASAIALLALFRTPVAHAATPTEHKIKRPAAPKAPVSPALAFPVGRWLVEGENQRCTATRDYVDGATKLVFFLRPTPFDDPIRIGLIEPSIQESVMEVGGAGFGDSRPNVRVQVVFAKMADARHIADIPIPRTDIERAVVSNELWVYSKSLNRRLKMTGLKGALSVLGSCERQLIADLGMSIEDQNRMAEKPHPKLPLFRYFDYTDYPSPALKSNRGGVVLAAIDIAADGEVGECKVVESSGTVALDERTCRVARRAPFQAAIDKQGKRMRALFFFSIRWTS